MIFRLVFHSQFYDHCIKLCIYLHFCIKVLCMKRKKIILVLQPKVATNNFWLESKGKNVYLILKIRCLLKENNAIYEIFAVRCLCLVGSGKINVLFNRMVCRTCGLWAYHRLCLSHLECFMFRKRRMRTVRQ